MLVDLHCHTTASDGSLSPGELVERAMNRGVDLLAITDHDTTAAFAELEAVPGTMRLVHGVELSTSWSGVNVHILGLNITPGHPVMAEAVAAQRDARAERAKIIADRLEKKGIPGSFEAVRHIAAHRAVGRPDFAKYLVDCGVVSSVNEAFDRYLGAGKLGDVKAMWPELATIVGWIRAAGGTAVLAHPTHYKMTNAKLRRLLAEFVEVGGEGLEVCNGRPPETELRYLRDLCREYGLCASLGSDFHHPSNWLELGCEASLLGSCTPVWERWNGAEKVAGC